MLTITILYYIDGNEHLEAWMLDIDGRADVLFSLSVRIWLKKAAKSTLTRLAKD